MAYSPRNPNGSATSANSSPVVVASDQSAIPVSQSGTWNVGTVTTVTGITNVVHVDDNAGSLTVDNAGTFAVQAASATVPVSTMNSASANSGLNVAIAGVFDDASPTAITENSFGFIRMSANRNIYNTIRDAAGNERGVNVTAGNALQSDLTSLAGTATAVNNGTASAGTQRVTIASDSTGNIATIGTSVTPGTAAANLGKAEDAAHTTGDTGVMLLAVRETSPTDLSGNTTNGDYEPLQVSRDGGLWASTAAAPQGGWSVATGSIGATKTDIGTANTAGCVGGWFIYNPNSSVAYVQFFNTQASGVTLGTTAPVYSIGIPATSGANVMSEAGIQHSTAICIAVTTTRAGLTGPSSTVDYNIFYKQ